MKKIGGHIILAFLSAGYFLAQAKFVPVTDGSQTLVDNPYKTW